MCCFEILYPSSFVIGSHMFLAEGNQVHSALRKEYTIVAFVLLVCVCCNTGLLCIPYGAGNLAEFSLHGCNIKFNTRTEE
jgi:hypothetical protein